MTKLEVSAPEASQFQTTCSGEAQAAEPACFTNSAVRKRYSKIIANVN